MEHLEPLWKHLVENPNIGFVVFFILTGLAALLAWVSWKLGGMLVKKKQQEEKEKEEMDMEQTEAILKVKGRLNELETKQQLISKDIEYMKEKVEKLENNSK